MNNHWVEKLEIAERSGGVSLSETDCYVLRLYLEALLRKANDSAISMDKAATKEFKPNMSKL